MFEVASKVWLSAWTTSREDMAERRLASGSASRTTSKITSSRGFEDNPLHDEADDMTNYDYIGVYGLLGLFQSVAYVAGILMVNERTLHASMKLHQSIFHRVLHSTIDFIWTTPVGQVMKNSVPYSCQECGSHHYSGHLHNSIGTYVY